MERYCSLQFNASNLSFLLRMYSAILLVPADIRSLRKLVMAHLELSGELLASNLVKWYVQHYFHGSIFIIFFMGS